MTIIIPEAMTKVEAERISSRISLRLDTIADNYVAVMPLIREAISRQAHMPLGYPSAGAYVSERFGDSLAKMGVDMRREFVTELSAAGLSTRAIAPIFGVDHSRIVRDKQAEVVRTAPPAAPVSDTHHEFPAEPEWSPEEGFVTPSAPVEFQAAGESFVEIDDQTAAAVSESSVPVAKSVTGLDGKTYEVKPRQERRRSLVDEAFTANRALVVALGAVQGIRADDRFNRNKADIQAALQPSVRLALEILSDLAITSMEESNV